MSKHPRYVYEVTGNTKPMRLGKVFPTGWTPLTVPHGSPVQVVARTQHPYQLRGTAVRFVGEIEFAEMIRRQA